MLRWVALATAVSVLVVATAAGSAGPQNEIAGDEEIVGGHTVHTTIENQPAESLSVVGDVHCRFEVMDVTLTVPPSVGDADAGCDADTRVFGSAAAAPDPRREDLQPTGRTLEAEGPQGETWTTTEHAYEVLGETWKAWTVDAREPMVDPGTGETYRFVAAFPADAAGGETIQLRAGS